MTHEAPSGRDEHEEFLATLADSGMFTRSGVGGFWASADRFAALGRVLNRDADSGARWVLTGVIVGAGIGLVVAGIVTGR